ncbi:MAG: 50S ribosomal protein L16 [Planctomycetales bacterium]|nr:50S ribosomal protein L16 [Planctomycetales bacterium]
MPLMPKRVKYRKTQRGRVRGNATRGTEVSFGSFGLQVLDRGWVSGQQLEAARLAASYALGTEGRLYVRVFPHKAISAKPAETRMGTGKGEPEYYVAVVKPGTVLCEVGGVPEEMARLALQRVCHKLPVRTRLVKRRTW